MVDRIVAINPGATSTKIGYFENDELKFKKEITDFDFRVHIRCFLDYLFFIIQNFKG